MADTTALKNRIRAAIKANDNQEITGPVLQQTLLDIVDELDLYPELENEANTRQQADTQLQTAINAIHTQIDNGYVYAGIATPSTVPVSGKVFYIATASGTYTNFENQVVTQGISILKRNDSTWVKEVIIGIDDEPIYGSNNLVKSGGVKQIPLYGDSIDFSVTLGASSWNRIVEGITLKEGIKYRIKISTQTGSGDTYVRLCSTASNADVVRQVTFGSSDTEKIIDYVPDTTRRTYSLHTYGAERSAVVSLFIIDNIRTENLKNDAVSEEKLSPEVRTKLNPTFDSEPIFQSTHLVKSGGVKQLVLSKASIDLDVDFGGSWTHRYNNITLYAGVTYKITAMSSDSVESSNFIRLTSSDSSADVVKQIEFPANKTSVYTTVTISETKSTYALFFTGSSRNGVLSIEKISNISTENLKNDAVSEEKLSPEVRAKINPTIDNVPTYKSAHLVKSGGVKQMLLDGDSVDFPVTLGGSGWERPVNQITLIKGIKYRIKITAPSGSGNMYVRFCWSDNSNDIIKQVAFGSSDTEKIIDYLADETRQYYSFHTTGDERPSSVISIFKIENIGAENIKSSAIESRHLSQEVRDMITVDNAPTLSLINRPQKMVVASNNEKVTNRSQFTMTTIKSFVPALDYRGRLVFEYPSNPYDETKKMLFEEHIVHTNRNYGGDWVHFVSDNGKNFATYIQQPKRSIFGYQTPVMSIGGDSDGLLLGFITVTVNSVTKDLLLRSLDGGRSFEPAISTYRAKLTINASELTNGTSVVIDSNTYSVITVSAAQTYLSALTETTSEARRSAARTYLADKILLSANTQDVLRTLACALIENDYKVRLKADSIDVYYKEIGDAGNNAQTISVGGTSKTFNGGVSMTDDAIIAACLLEMGATGKTYIDDSTIQSKDLQEVCSMFNIDGSWHLIGYCCKNDYYDFTPTPLANIDLVIDDVDNLRTSTYTYNVIYNTIMNSSDYNTQPLCEPIGSYNYSYGSNGIILVGFRQQGGNRAYYCYSLDKGATWSDIKALPGNATVNSDNLFIGLVRNPLLDTRHQNYFYDRNNVHASNNIFIALLAERRYSVVYAATAELTENLENLKWSNFMPLHHFADPDILNHGGIDSTMNIYSGDINGNSSSPAMCYAPIHKGVAILYSGFQEFDGFKNCFKSLLAIEDC